MRKKENEIILVHRYRGTCIIIEYRIFMYVIYIYVCMYVYYIDITRTSNLCKAVRGFLERSINSIAIQLAL